MEYNNNNTHTDWQINKSIVDCNRFMLENQIACDVTFVVGEEKKEISAHKYVLISRSPVFFAMLEGPLAETTKYIPVPDVAPHVFSGLLRYLYFEDIDVDGDSILPMMYVAKKYNIQHLVNKCVSTLKDTLSIENVCSILEYAHFFDETGLQKLCMKFVLTNAEAVLKHDDFLILCPSCMEKIVSSDDLEAKERTVFECVLDWSREECMRKEMDVSEENIRLVLKNILYHVRFSCMNVQYFCDKVLTAGVFTDCEKDSLLGNLFSDQNCNVEMNFDTAPRKKHLSKFCRYESIQRNESWTYASGWRDAIAFQVDREITLCGFSLYRSHSGKGIYKVTYTIYEGYSATLAHGNIEMSSDSELTELEGLFHDPVIIRPDSNVSLVLLIRGPSSLHGESGKRKMTCEDVTFIFSDSPWSENLTNVERGQIPGLVFHTNE